MTRPIDSIAMTRDDIAALKLLTESTRLRILGALAGGPRTIEALSSELDLSSRTLLRSLGALQRGRLVGAAEESGRAVYEFRPARLSHLGAVLDRFEHGDSAEGEPAPGTRQGWTPEDGRILAGFLDGGRLSTIPAQARKRMLVLRYLAEQVFEQDREYPEAEVNMLLALRHPDVAALRRYLVDAGFMQRAAGIYRLRPASAWKTGAEGHVAGPIRPGETIEAATGGVRSARKSPGPARLL